MCFECMKNISSKSYLPKLYRVVDIIFECSCVCLPNINIPMYVGTHARRRLLFYSCVVKESYISLYVYLVVLKPSR